MPSVGEFYSPAAGHEQLMKKKPTAKPRRIPAEYMRPEYRFDYRKASPNRYAGRTDKGRLVVVLDPDIAQVFTTPESVNRALRALIPCPRRRNRKPLADWRQVSKAQPCSIQQRLAQQQFSRLTLVLLTTHFTFGFLMVVKYLCHWSGFPVYGMPLPSNAPIGG